MSGLGFLIGATALAMLTWHIFSNSPSTTLAFSSGPMTLAVLQEPGDVPLARAPLFGRHALLPGVPAEVDLVVVNSGLIPFDVSLRPVLDGNADELRWVART